MRETLEAPVLLGELSLAPTTELAGLAELAVLSSHEDRLDALTRIALAIEAEDRLRVEIARARSEATPGPLPRRRPASATRRVPTPSVVAS